MYLFDTGGGRSSARETIGRVAAGAIAAKILKLYCDVEIVAYVKRVQEITFESTAFFHDTVTRDMVIVVSATWNNMW